MPIYDFYCSVCGRTVEVVQQGLNRSPPLCCGELMSKMPSATAMIIMKGEGGYPSRRKEFADRKALMSRKQVPYFMPETKKLAGESHSQASLNK